MNSENVECNKMIALFMGYPEDEIQAEEWCGCNILKENSFTGDKDMVPAKYHSSWSWIMPVILAIKECMPEIGDEDEFESLMNEHVAIWECICRDALPTINIDIVYKHVCGFVKWHSLHQKIKHP